MGFLGKGTARRVEVDGLWVPDPKHQAIATRTTALCWDMDIALWELP